MKKIRIGSATGWSRDRFEPAQALLADGAVDYLCFDAMSEITMAILQARRLEDKSILPYDPYLERRLGPLLRESHRKGVKIITNQGWLDPVAAAARITQLAREQGISGLKVAAVTGSVITDRLAGMNLQILETAEPLSKFSGQIVSGEVYQGAAGIVEALDAGADVVITTRVADACLYLAPLVHEYGWDFDDHHKMAKGMVIGHLLECGCQLTGGYFADPGYKDVPNLHDVGNPIAEIDEDGRVILTKLEGTGGLLDLATCKEQLLYEVQDPANYYCPDVVADFTKVTFRQLGPDKVEVFADGAGKPRTPTLKALIGMREGFIAEEMVLFAGPGSLARAEATKELLLHRFEKVGLKADELRWDFIGHNSVHRESSPPWDSTPYEVVLRVAIKTQTREEASKLQIEVDPLAVNGLSGTGKWGTSTPGAHVRPIVGLSSTLVPRELVQHEVTILQ